MVTTSSMVGECKPGCGLCPALSFKDLHHPCWGEGWGKSGPASAWAGDLLLPSGIRGRKTSSSSAEEVSSSHAGEGELLLPGQGAAVRPPSGRRSCCAQVAAVSDLADGADFDNESPVGRKRRQLQQGWHAGSAGSGATSGAASYSSVLP
jgi:hypothetical protein